MHIILNGKPADVSAGTVEELVGELTSRPQGIAVAVNRTVVPRSAWRSTGLVEQDQVEVLTAAPGG